MEEMRSSSNTADEALLIKSCVVVTSASIKPVSDDSSSRRRHEHECALIYKTKYKRREIVFLVCFLPLDDGDHGRRNYKLSNYQDTIKKLKIKAKKTGCTCASNSLHVVKMEYNDNYKNKDYTWWNQLFPSSSSSYQKQHPPQNINNNYQLMYFDLVDDDENGKRKVNNNHFPSRNTGHDNDWSLLLHRINSCHSIKEIIRSGNIPDSCSSDDGNNGDNNKNNNDSDTTKIISPTKQFSLPQRIQKFFFDNSLTVLHFRDLYFNHNKQQGCPSSSYFNFPSIVLVRYIWSFLRALWENNNTTNNNNNNTATKKKNENLLSNKYYNCSHCSKPCLVPSKSDLAMQTVHRLDVFLSALFDMILGLMVCAVLLFASRNQELFQRIYRNGKLKAFQYLEDQSFMLETFPAGFKLNVQLTHNMGSGIRNLLHHQKSVLFATLWNVQGCQEYLIPIVATLAAVGGWTTFLAVMVDLWRLEFIHLILLAIFFRKLYRAELYLLSALFRLFRGKKRNILRQRTDTMQYDAMQLLVGTIAFCICVFLWTTIMVYYSFFVIWNLSIHLPIVCCWVLYLLGRSIPWGSLYYRFRHPHWFPKDLYIKFDDVITIDDSKNVQVSSLESILESPVHILFSRITNPLKHLFKWYLISFLEIVYPRADNTSHSILPLKLLMENLKSLQDNN
jgi:hypothetical protein